MIFDNSCNLIERCRICGGELSLLIHLPQLPLTALYSSGPQNVNNGIDQSLNRCLVCGHAQLGRALNPSILYDERYLFRTSSSATARCGTDFFLSSLKKMVCRRKFRCAVDIGCNDLHLLKMVREFSDVCIGIDPIWKGREDCVHEDGISVVGEFVEGCDLTAFGDLLPDLIVCRHTIEHMVDPIASLRPILDIAPVGAMVAVEFPSFSSLVEGFRFDHIFHQHVHYFTVSSIRRLMSGLGAGLVGVENNYCDWGSVFALFKKGYDDSDSAVECIAFTPDEITKRYEIFRAHLSNIAKLLELAAITGPVYGYGAAQMLPVLDYHMGGAYKGMNAVLDDDISKDGSYYVNLEVPIRYTGTVDDLENSTTVITAVDHARVILKKLERARVRNIIVPMVFI